jgi:hypothetical protein
MGYALAQQGLDLIYGAGRTGLMGALADAALEGGARVIGIIPMKFNNPVLTHQGLTELHVVETLHERKALMADKANAFIALPGGFGTFEEFFEILTWAQIGLHHRPIGLLNVNGYFDPFNTLIDRARQDGFLYKEHPSLIVQSTDPPELLARLANYHPPRNLHRWVDRKEEG